MIPVPLNAQVRLDAGVADMHRGFPSPVTQAGQMTRAKLGATGCTLIGTSNRRALIHRNGRLC